jgi:hypothetical protein
MSLIDSVLASLSEYIRFRRLAGVVDRPSTLPGKSLETIGSSGLSSEHVLGKLTITGSVSIFQLEARHRSVVSSTRILPAMLKEGPNAIEPTGRISPSRWPIERNRVARVQECRHVSDPLWRRSECHGQATQRR